MDKQLLIVSLFLVILSGCATFPKANDPLEKSNLTMGTIKSKIIKGQTTQEEVLKLLGSPNLVTKNRVNNEVWNYNRMAFESKSGEDAGGLLLWGGSRAMSTATTKSFDLIIEFESNDVVKEYSVISAQF